MNRLLPRFALAGVLVMTSATMALAQSEDALVKYFRKKNNLPPTATVTVQGLKDSANFKGSKEGVLNIAGPQGNRAVSFIASPDLKYVVVGDVLDTTVDPSKAVMAKMSLTGEPFK